MKKILLFVAIIATQATMALKAQEENAAFEGEIRFETYENYSDYILKMPNSIYFDGVHKLRLILKGDKMHLIDETTGCHTIADASLCDPLSKGELKIGKPKKGEKSPVAYLHYCDFTKSGMDMTKNPASYSMLVPYDMIYQDGQKAPLTGNSFAATSTTKTFADHECSLWEGQINHNMGGMEQSYDVKAYVSPIVAPASYKWSLYGLPVDNIAMNWVQKYDGGHVSIMNVGELSYYIEGDITEIIPREVSDEEFEAPADYKISGSSSNAFALMGYYKGIKKELVKRGIKGGDKSDKSTGVHYKTDDQWDF